MDNNISLDNLINLLSKSDRVKLLQAQLGMKDCVDIETFLMDPYYYGNNTGLDSTGRRQIYQVWYDRLKDDIYPNPVTTDSSWVVFKGAIGCLAGDTKIKLLDGSIHEIQELYENRSKYIGKYVYSCDTTDGEWKPGRINNIWYTGIKPVVRLTLIDKDKVQSTITCTHDHKFLLVDGTYIEAKDLNASHSIQSLYLRNTGYGFYGDYEEYYDGYSWYPTHRNVARYTKPGFHESNHIHHIDFNKLNNDPNNLQLFESNSDHFYEHLTEYWSHEENRSQRAEWMAGRNVNGNTFIDKARKVAFILNEEYYHYNTPTDLLDLQYKITELKNKGYLNYHSPWIYSLEEFNQYTEEIIKLGYWWDYKSSEYIEANLKYLNEHRLRTIERNKARARNDITIDLIRSTAKQLNTYNVCKLAEHLKCSKSKINSVIYDDYYTIQEFAEDLGFNYVNHRVIKIEYLDPIPVYDLTIDDYHNYGIVDSQGSLVFTHNTGKSTCSKAMMAYDIYKITRMENPWAFFELMEKPIIFAIYNVHKWKAQLMVDELWECLNKSPYFQEQFNDPNSNIHKIIIMAAGKVNDFISNDVFSAMLSELNFAPPWVASDIIDTAVSRVESRFQKGLGLFNHVILDCSDTDLTSAVEYFCKYSPYAKNALIYTTSIWQAKPQFYFHKGSFRVYAGSSKVKAHVMVDGEDERELDKDRIFIAPMELYDQAVSNIDKFLQEKAGRAIVSTDQFMDLDKIVPIFQIDKSYDDIAWVDFYDPKDSYIEILKEAIEQLPKDRQIFGRIDLGVANDRCGFAVGYVENLNAKNYEGTVQYDPDIRVPIAIGFSRLQGQETAINKLIDLVLYIHDRRPFYSFTTDTYQSTQIRQTLTLNKINNFALSVDRTDEPYIIFKNMIYRNKVVLPKNRVLQNELAHLKYQDGKVDHPALMDASGEEGTNSKDIADAVAGIAYEMSKATEEVMELPLTNNPSMIDDYSKVIADLIAQQTKDFIINQFTNQYPGRI